MDKSTNHFNNPLVKTYLGGLQLTRLWLSHSRLRCRGTTMQDDLCKTETHILSLTHTHSHHTVTDSWTCRDHHDSRGQKFGISLQGGELWAYPGKAAFPWGEGIPLPLLEPPLSFFQLFIFQLLSLSFLPPLCESHCPPAPRFLSLYLLPTRQRSPSPTKPWASASAPREPADFLLKIRAEDNSRRAATKREENEIKSWNWTERQKGERKGKSASEGAADERVWRWKRSERNLTVTKNWNYTGQRWR